MYNTTLTDAEVVQKFVQGPSEDSGGGGIAGGMLRESYYFWDRREALDIVLFNHNDILCCAEMRHNKNMAKVVNRSPARTHPPPQQYPHN